MVTVPSPVPVFAPVIPAGDNGLPGAAAAVPGLGHPAKAVRMNSIPAVVVSDFVIDEHLFPIWGKPCNLIFLE